LIRALKRVRVPPPAGAALVILALIGTLALAVYELAEPAREWGARAPATLQHVEEKLHRFSRPMEQVTKTAEQIEEATEVGPGGTPEVVVKGPSLVSRFMGQTQSLVAGVLQVLVLLYFLLAAGDLFLQKLIRVLPRLGDRKKAVMIARETEASISVYLLTVALVNVLEGIAVAAAMWAIGMPNPALWGALAAALEFIPYIGAGFLMIVLTLAGLATFDDVGRALLAPGSFLAINLLQANVLSPFLLGHRLTLNPVAIVVGLAFWWWIWGIPGAFIAVPLLATFKIFCDHIETLTPVGEFLGK
nr:AI-2E family transporter [Gemmatimonadota bacterium]